MRRILTPLKWLALVLAVVLATVLAVREATRLADPGKPLHLDGYSNGGALAMKYALDALEDGALPRPARVVLLSPMIGITSLARFAGVLGWPAVFPSFAKGAWLDVVPEFHPFKYNSFPVNAARQSSLVARATGADRARRGSKAPGRAAAGADVPVGRRLHREHARDRRASRSRGFAGRFACRRGRTWDGSVAKVRMEGPRARRASPRDRGCGARRDDTVSGARRPSRDHPVIRRRGPSSRAMRRSRAPRRLSAPCGSR